MEGFWGGGGLGGGVVGVGHHIMSERARGRHGHKGLKPESVVFWHNTQNWLKKKKKKKKKTCGKRLQTDFSVRQVPALPSAFSFTSQSVCSQQIPPFIRPSLSLSLFHHISLIPSPCVACATRGRITRLPGLWKTLKIKRDFFFFFIDFRYDIFGKYWN